MKDAIPGTADTLEQVLLVRVYVGGESPGSGPDNEMISLIEAAGGEVVCETSQKRRSPDPSFFVGKGKAEEICEIAVAGDITTIVLDHNLTPGQVTRLEETTGCKVIDRTELILAIFAGQARSREAILQIELAQLRYALPRLSGMWHHFSRLGAGIGTRGPGETQLEIDRRRARSRISLLENRITEIEDRWRVAASRRSEMFRVAIVGYTNAGKSTLLNALCGSDALIADRPFATLDTTSRRLELPDRSLVLLSDTVGFIERLPETLVASFHTTLNSAREADLLLVVIDRSSPYRARHLETVRLTLDRIGVDRNVPRLLVWSKTDLTSSTERMSNGIGISAIHAFGLDELVCGIEASRDSFLEWFTVTLKYHDSGLMNMLFERCVVKQVLDRADGSTIVAAGALRGFQSVADRLQGTMAFTSYTVLPGPPEAGLEQVNESDR